VFCPVCGDEFRAGFTRCAECDTELGETQAVRRQVPPLNLKFLRVARNAAFIGGLVFLVLAIVPPIVVEAIKDFGYFPGNSGVGIQLMFVYALWPAMVLIAGGVLAWIICGVYVAVKPVDASAGEDLGANSAPPGRRREDVDRDV
jgi:hypothetical protein